MSVLMMARKAAIDWVNKVDLATLVFALPGEVFGDKVEKLRTPRIEPMIPAGPELGRMPAKPITVKEAWELVRKVRGKKRNKMSAAMRKAVSVRMKKYWADRRKAKSKKKS